MTTKIRNTFIIFLVSGFWHGANWTFIIWGFLNALFFLPLLITNNNRNNISIVAEGKMFPTIKEFFSILLTFTITTFAWIFFRSNTVSQAIEIIRNIFKFNTNEGFQYLTFDRYSIELVFLLLLFLFIEWISRERVHPIFGKFKSLKVIAVITMILIFGVFSDAKEFIYFQF